MKKRYYEYMSNKKPSDVFIAQLEKTMKSELQRRHKRAVMVKRMVWTAACGIVLLVAILALFGQSGMVDSPKTQVVSATEWENDKTIMDGQKDDSDQTEAGPVNNQPISILTNPMTNTSAFDHDINLTASNDYFVVAGFSREGDSRRPVFAVFDPVTQRCINHSEYSECGFSGTYKAAVVIDENRAVAIRASYDSFQSELDCIANGSVCNVISLRDISVNVFLANNCIFVNSCPKSRKTYFDAFDLDGNLLWGINWDESIRLAGVEFDGLYYYAYGYRIENEENHSLVFCLSKKGEVVWRYDGAAREEFINAAVEDTGELLLLGNSYVKKYNTFLFKMKDGLSDWRRDYFPGAFSCELFEAAETKTAVDAVRYGEGMVVVYKLGYPGTNSVALRYIDTEGKVISEWVECFPELNSCNDVVLATWEDTVYLAVSGGVAELADWGWEEKDGDDMIIADIPQHIFTKRLSVPEGVSAE